MKNANWGLGMFLLASIVVVGPTIFAWNGQASGIVGGVLAFVGLTVFTCGLVISGPKARDTMSGLGILLAGTPLLYHAVILYQTP